MLVWPMSSPKMTRMFGFLGVGVCACALSRPARDPSVNAAAKTVPPTTVPPTTVLLLSDGKPDGGRATALAGAQEARRLHVPVSTISLGTAAGTVRVPIPGEARAPAGTRRRLGCASPPA